MAVGPAVSVRRGRAVAPRAAIGPRGSEQVAGLRLIGEAEIGNEDSEQEPQDLIGLPVLGGGDERTDVFAHVCGQASVRRAQNLWMHRRRDALAPDQYFLVEPLPRPHACEADLDVLVGLEPGEPDKVA